MKPRSDSKLLNLPEQQQAQLADWLLSGIPYHRALDLVKKEFHLSTSIRALSVFYDRICSAELIARRRRAVSTAQEVAEEAAKSPGRFDAATIDALKQKAFELSVSPGAHPSEVKSLFMLVLRARDQDLSERELALARDRFQFNAAAAALKCLPDLRKIAADKSLDSQARLLAVRRKLFGETPS